MQILTNLNFRKQKKKFLEQLVSYISNIKSGRKRKIKRRRGKKIKGIIVIRYCHLSKISKIMMNLIIAILQSIHSLSINNNNNRNNNNNNRNYHILIPNKIIMNSKNQIVIEKKEY